MYDVIVIGAGPAGMASGIYAAAHKLKTLVVTEKLSEKPDSGFDIIDPQFVASNFKKSLKDCKDFLELRDKTKVISLEKNVVSFSVETKKGEILYGRSVIICTGKSDLVFDLLTYKAGTGRIKVDANMKTNTPGVFAAGEASDTISQNVITVAGEGAKAVLSVLAYLDK